MLRVAQATSAIKPTTTTAAYRPQARDTAFALCRAFNWPWELPYDREQRYYHFHFCFHCDESWPCNVPSHDWRTDTWDCCARCAKSAT